MLKFGKAKREIKYLTRYQGVRTEVQILGSAWREKSLKLKKHDETLTKEEWNNNTRYWASDSSNKSKYIIKKMEKDIGTIYNSYPVTKIMNIYIIQVDDNERVSEMEYCAEFDLCIAELNKKNSIKRPLIEPKNEAIKPLRRDPLQASPKCGTIDKVNPVARHTQVLAPKKRIPVVLNDKQKKE